MIGLADPFPTTVGAKIVTRLARGILLVVVGHSLKMEDEIPQRVLVGQGSLAMASARPSSLVSVAAMCSYVSIGYVCKRERKRGEVRC